MSSMRTLIADDDRVSLEVASRTLTRWGFDVVVARDGAEAWNAIRTSSEPTIAILDWMMPELDGVQICRLVRSECPAEQIYVLLLTSKEARADLVAALEAGADDYLTKPFDPDELRARIQVGVRILTLQQRLTARVAELQESLARVKQLQGLVPICSYCKRIRNDQNYWQQLEHYVSEHTDATFSHGICPKCYAALTAREQEEARTGRQ